jgi:hypothetical protein
VRTRLGPTCWLLPVHQVWTSEAGTQPAVSGNRSSWNSTAWWQTGKWLVTSKSPRPPAPCPDPLTFRGTWWLMGMIAVSLSCRTRSTSQPMTVSARRGMRAAPRSTLSSTHWVTVRNTMGNSKEGGEPEGRGTGEQGLTWAQCWLLQGHLIAVQLTLALKQAQSEFHPSTSPW